SQEGSREGGPGGDFHGVFRGLRFGVAGGEGGGVGLLCLEMLAGGGQESLEAVEFLRRWVAREDPPEGLGGAVGVVLGLVGELLSEGSGEFDEHFVIEEREALERGVRDVPPGDAFFAAGGVEDREHGEGGGSFRKRINAT